MQVALVGIGKIALDQHVPALAASPEWDLAATVSRNGAVPGIESWRDFDAFLENRPDIRVVSLCLPPAPRFDYAQRALLAGRHVMLEKPPGASLTECQILTDLAKQNRVSLFASWHSRAAAMVDAAQGWLSTRTVTSARITWAEDVRHWHPGQDWVFEPGGMGVFDPGINALSILTKILPNPVRLIEAELEVPQNRQMPIAARLKFSGNVSALFDWQASGTPRWDIEVSTPDGTLLLTDGGARMQIDGAERSQTSAETPSGEYPRLYARMADLVKTGQSEVDVAPLRHVADALMLGHRKIVAAFEF